jgi:hypothetical protein
MLMIKVHRVRGASIYKILYGHTVHDSKSDGSYLFGQPTGHSQGLGYLKLRCLPVYMLLDTKTRLCYPLSAHANTVNKYIYIYIYIYILK